MRALRIAQGFLESYREWASASVVPGRPLPPPVEIARPTHIPVDMQSAAPRDAYQAKLRQIAAEQPEFLEALVDYSARKEQYEGALRAGTQGGRLSRAE